MTATIQKHPLTEAQPLAVQIWELLKPHCFEGFCKVAGSIRRQKPEVKDMEIVCVPLTTTVPDGFFATKEMRSGEFVSALETIGQRIKGDPLEGKYCQYEMYLHGINVDVFMVEKSNFGMQYLIRTGPADFSQKILWKFNNKGYHSVGGYPTKGEERLSFTSEQAVFDFLGEPFVAPKDR